MMKKTLVAAILALAMVLTANPVLASSQPSSAASSVSRSSVSQSSLSQSSESPSFAPSSLLKSSGNSPVCNGACLVSGDWLGGVMSTTAQKFGTRIGNQVRDFILGGAYSSLKLGVDHVLDYHPGSYAHIDGADMRSWECCAYANYFFYKLVGHTSYTNTHYVTNIASSQLTADGIKDALSKCLPGAHIRIQDGNITHSMVYLFSEDKGFFVLSWSFSYITCQFIPFASLASAWRGAGGRFTVQMPNDYPSVQVNSEPKGAFDAVVSNEPGKIVVTGWAFDPDVNASQISVHVYVGGPCGTPGVEGTAITANVSRPDVNNVFGISGDHGFAATVATGKTGNQPVYVYAIDTAGGNNPCIGSKTVSICEEDDTVVIVDDNGKDTHPSDDADTDDTGDNDDTDDTDTGDTDTDDTDTDDTDTGTDDTDTDDADDEDDSDEEEVDARITDPTAVSVTRIAGKNRYETAAEIARAAFPQGAAHAVLISGRSFADALSAGGYAGAAGVPILLSDTDSLPEATENLIRDWKISDIYIIGGEASVSRNVENELTACGVTDIMRAGGANRIETADIVFEDSASLLMKNSFRACIVTTGMKAADALSVSPWSYGLGMPVLLADRNGNLNPETLEIVNSFPNVYILGGEDSVSADAQNSITANVTRIAGNNRYETSALIAQTFMQKAGGTFENAAIASGADSHFADALVGGMLQGPRKAPILLTGGTIDTCMNLIAGKAKNVSILGDSI